jgi:hypothetical protein
MLGYMMGICMHRDGDSWFPCLHGNEQNAVCSGNPNITSVKTRWNNSYKAFEGIIYAVQKAEVKEVNEHLKKKGIHSLPNRSMSEIRICLILICIDDLLLFCY